MNDLNELNVLEDVVCLVVFVPITQGCVWRNVSSGSHEYIALLLVSFHLLSPFLASLYFL